MVQVMPLDKAGLDAAVACVEQTYRDGDELLHALPELIYTYKNVYKKRV